MNAKINATMSVVQNCKLWIGIIVWKSEAKSLEMNVKASERFSMRNMAQPTVTIRKVMMTLGILPIFS